MCIPEAFQSYAVIAVPNKCVLPKASDAHDEKLELSGNAQLGVKIETLLS